MKRNGEVAIHKFCQHYPNSQLVAHCGSKIYTETKSDSEVNCGNCLKAGCDSPCRICKKAPRLLDDNCCGACKRRRQRSSYVLGEIKSHPSTFYATFSRTYGSIKHRCLNHPRYIGLPFMDKISWHDFMEDTLEDRKVLYDEWKASGFLRRLSPSIDRINNKDGYRPENLRWVPLHVNSRRADHSNQSCLKKRPK